MKKLAVFFLLLMVSIRPAFAAEPAPAAEASGFSEWMSYYYMHKDASKTGQFIQWLQSAQILENKSTAVPSIAAFLSFIFRDNSTQISEWVKSANPTGNTKKAVELGLWLSGRGDAIPELFNETPKFSKASARSLADISPQKPEHLDMMWSAFFATGEEKYVQKIINVLDEHINLSGEKTIDMLTRGAAQWSLSSNMLQHELVNRLVHKEILARSGEVKEKLQAISMSVEKRIEKNSFPNKDGEFSAMLIVTDEGELKEYGKPSSEGIYFREKSKAKRGDVVAIKLVFAGMALSNDLQSDVTFDMKISDPTGKIYDGVDNKGLIALKRKVPVRFSVFDNSSFIKVRFEPKDKLGKYTIAANIHDNIGKREILLVKGIELTQ